jgi:hypothetical protein
MEVSGQRHAQSAFPSPRKEPRYSLNTKLGMSQSQPRRFEKGKKSFAPSGIFFSLSRYSPLIHFVILNPSVLLHVTYDPY